MAREVRTFDVVVPTGTAKASPQVTNLLNLPRTVTRVQVRVPPGPRGEVGWQLAVNGTAVIPLDQAQFIVTDDEVVTWDTEGYPNSGQWELHAYNTGAYQHTIYVRMECDPVGSGAGTSSTPLPVPAAQLAGGVPVPAAPPPPPSSSPPPPLPPPPPLTGPGGPGGPQPVEQPTGPLPPPPRPPQPPTR